MKLTIEQYAAQADLFGLELVNAPRLEDVRYRVRADQTLEQAEAWAAYNGTPAKVFQKPTAHSRRPLAEMQAIAAHIRETLAPACDLCEIAGSVRRLKAEPKDVEIVAVGRGRELLSLTDELLKRGVIAHRIDKNGRKAYGEKMRRVTWEGVPLDLFMCTAPEFGYTFHLRTGDADWSHAFVVKRGAFGVNHENGERLPGMLPIDLTLKDNRLWRAGAALDTETEDKLYAAYGLLHIPAHERNKTTLFRLAEVSHKSGARTSSA